MSREDEPLVRRIPNYTDAAFLLIQRALPRRGKGEPAARLSDLFRARHRVATGLRPGMKKFFLMTLLVATPVSAQTDQPAPPAPLTTREQVQADRARAAAEEKSAPTARPWDRGADGKRPWERGATAK